MATFTEDVFFRQLPYSSFLPLFDSNSRDYRPTKLGRGILSIRISLLSSSYSHSCSWTELCELHNEFSTVVALFSTVAWKQLSEGRRQERETNRIGCVWILDSIGSTSSWWYCWACLIKHVVLFMGIQNRWKITGSDHNIFGSTVNIRRRSPWICS